MLLVEEQGTMSLRDQIQEQLAQLNCNIAQQMQAAEVSKHYPQTWYRFAPQANLYPIRTCCCDDGSDYKPKKTNCVNCGAALQGKHKCSYCDTYNE